MHEPMSPDLVGRENELRELLEAVRRSQQATSSLVLVGEPGIGKSALLTFADAAAADAGFVVLRAVGVESEAQLPFAGLHQLITPVLDSIDMLPLAERAAMLSALGLSDASRPDRYLVALAALHLLGAVADRQPAAFLVDDVQWLDPPSQEILAFIARRAVTESLLL